MMFLLLRTAAATVVATAPFTGESTEGFEGYPLTTAAIPCATGALSGLTDVCAPDAVVGGMQVRNDAFLGTCLQSPYAGAKFAGSNDGAVEMVFTAPLRKFGGRFSTHAATAGDVVIELYDQDDALIDSFQEPLGSCSWDWRGYEVQSGPGIVKVRIEHTLNQGALVNMDDLQVETLCGVSPTDADGDGSPACNDCDDTDPDVRPGMAEDCNGIDDDCSGTIDDGITTGPPATLQGGLCAGAVQECVDGAWVDPDYTAYPGYQQVETACDGYDNDCNGTVDDITELPPVGTGLGVCMELVSTCEGTDGWSEPDEADWSSLVAYESDEQTCDGLDNDCNGVVDDGLDAPPAALQDGVCAGAVMVCDGQGGWIEPDYTTIADYGQELCDEIDNDCNGLVDDDCIREKGCSTLDWRPTVNWWSRR